MAWELTPEEVFPVRCRVSWTRVADPCVPWQHIASRLRFYPFNNVAGVIWRALGQIPISGFEFGRDG